MLAFVGIFAPKEENNEIDNDHTTSIESCLEGWWYTTLLPSKKRIVVFHTDSDLPACKYEIERGGVRDRARGGGEGERGEIREEINVPTAARNARGGSSNAII